MAWHTGRHRGTDFGAYRFPLAFPPGGGFPGLADAFRDCPLSGACVKAEPATLFAAFVAFGSRKILAAFDATRLDVFSFLAILAPRLKDWSRLDPESESV